MLRQPAAAAMLRLIALLVELMQDCSVNAAVLLRCLLTADLNSFPAHSAPEEAAQIS
jgi:hypothetical protein